MCYRITRAPKGAAAFDVTSEQQYNGVVLDRMVKSKNNISSGLLHYEDNGAPAKLIFGPKDLSVSMAFSPSPDHCSKACLKNNNSYGSQMLCSMCACVPLPILCMTLSMTWMLLTLH